MIKIIEYNAALNLKGNAMNRTDMGKAIIQVAESTLHDKKYVSPIDILVGMKMLQPAHLLDWRKGKIFYLEKTIQGSLGKISYVMKCFRQWANKKGLKPSQTTYLTRTKCPKKELQFSKSGNPIIEKAYRTHYISPSLSKKKD